MNENHTRLLTRLTNVLDSLSEERVVQLLELEHDALLAFLQGSTEEKPIPEPAHENLRFEFTLGGKPVEAVGFLQNGEGPVRGKEAFRRTDNGHVITSEKDWWLFNDHREELPMQLKCYTIMTARTVAKDPGIVCGFEHVGSRWSFCGEAIVSMWGRRILILRHRVSPPSEVGA